MPLARNCLDWKNPRSMISPSPLPDGLARRFEREPRARGRTGELRVHALELEDRVGPGRLERALGRALLRERRRVREVADEDDEPRDRHDREHPEDERQGIDHDITPRGAAARSP